MRCDMPANLCLYKQQQHAAMKGVGGLPYQNFAQVASELALNVFFCVCQLEIHVGIY